MQLSVFICTYNPRKVYLRRVLDALSAQTLPKDQWELFLVDNASDELLSKTWDLSWHLNARHIRENQLGKTSALLSAIRESSGGILVIVDDDNVLDPNYLEHVSRIFDERPFLGVIGGRIEGEYEIPPPQWMHPYLNRLAIVDRGERELYTMLPGCEPILPYGAGMAIRHSIASYYTQLVREDPLRRRLDPIGGQLSRAGDTDLALCAFDLHFASGYYPQLELRHLIPAGRFKLEYMIRLLEEGEHSRYSLLILRGLLPPQRPQAAWRQLLGKVRGWLRLWLGDKRRVRLERALRRGQKRAFAEFDKLSRLRSGE